MTFDQLSVSHASAVLCRLMTVAFLRTCLTATTIACLLISGRPSTGETLPQSKASLPTPSTPPTPPNILLIVADDLGIHDLGIDNPEMRTPNINALAAEGVRFTRHYADATCSPTRAGLMTGLDPARLGFRPVQRGFSPDILTLPKVLSAAGYSTYHIGKWHVGNAIPELSPSQAGFAHWYGFLTQSELAGPSPDGIHFKWPRYDNPWLQTESLPPAPVSGHLTDVLTNKALETIRHFNAGPNPWFLNLWYYAPHTPIEPSARYAKNYPDTAKGRYRALVEQLDTSVGRITAQLEALGISDNTLVIFMSDNGGTNFVLDNNHPLTGRKGQFLEGGLRSPMIWRWPAHLAAGRLVDETVSYLDIAPTLAHLGGSEFSDPKFDLPGENLLPALTGGVPFPKRELFWEYETYDSHTYSVLDKDGRYRLNGYKGVKFLFDTQQPHLMSQDLLNAQPRVVDHLERAFERWRTRQHEISVTVEAVNTAGAAVVRGDGVQRSPGHGGFTFAIGVTPNKTAVATRFKRYIVNHPPYWQLRLDPTRALVLDMLGETLRGPALPEGECTSIIVSSYYHYSLRLPQNNKSIINLYVNGSLVDSSVRKHPAVPPNDFDRPTFIGFKADPGRLSQLRLTPPRFFNEMFVPGDERTSASRTIESLNGTLCPPLHEADTRVPQHS
jgi:arylsulfatase A-like enzyme